MRKLVTGSLALGLSLSLGGCSTLEEALLSPGPMASVQEPSAGPTPTATAGTTTAGTTTAGTTSDGSTESATRTTTPTVRPVDQTTPEAAMESWLAALVAGQGEDVCSLMASDGRAVESIKGAAAACGEALTPLLSSLQELNGMFEDVEIAGATVVEDLATFEAATTKPALAAQVIHRFKAVKIKEKWFVTE
ncbi:hypothetical protein [Intrasporangium sp. DVR]|uniref:hypothetical protein n=1 Tax=Intrasporangium sp. DVR TaxID=3127867 RepID=UPI00313A5DD1